MEFKSLVFAGLVSSLLITGCKKDIDYRQAAEQLSNSNTSIGSGSNSRLSYGDSVFYLQNQSGNYTVLPVSKPNVPGYFKVIPMGLLLDSATGRINVSQSETGLRYKVYYLGVNGDRLDSTKIVISGIDYKDAIYEIASTPNNYDTAFPIYNARPELLVPCGDDDEDDDGDLDDDDNACVFDETDLNNDGNDDIPGVIQDKLLVDIKKGTIDVEASFHAGVFGSSDPANGLSKDFTFYYRLQDASNRALNKISVRLYHFKKRSDIPQFLLDTLNLRNQISAAVNSRTANDSRVMSISSRLEFEARPKRPPVIIIISQ